MSHNISSSTWGGSPSRYLSIAQHNSLGSWDVFLSFFNSFASAKCSPDIVRLQDPPFWRSRLSSFQNYTSFAPPAGSGRKPKVAFYVSTLLLAQATVLPAFFDRPDVAALDLFGVALFGKSFSHFRILKIYNLWTKRTSQMTVSPLIAFSDLSHPTLYLLPSTPTPQRNLLHPSHISPGWLSLALASSTRLRSTLASPLVALAAPQFLIFPLLPLCCFPFARHGTPSSPPLARIMSLSRSYSHISFPHPLLLPPTGPLPTGPPSNRSSTTSLFPPLPLCPLGSPSKPGSTDTSHASPLFLPPIPPSSAPLTARNPGGLSYSPSLEKNFTLPQEKPAPPTCLLIAQTPTSPRGDTSKPSKPPRRLIGGPSSLQPPHVPYGRSKNYPWENSLLAFPPFPILAPPPRLTTPYSTISFRRSLPDPAPPSSAPSQTAPRSVEKRSPLP